ncbi:valine--tRNA ligase [bacterium]|nr:valine--tRNA ligase [bacterium]
MKIEIPTVYDFQEVQQRIDAIWLERGAFAAFPDQREKRYVIMMPLPNVTGALHMGHAMDNVMQDLLVRWHRMMGDNTLWMPGIDHAGIATQAVVEKRLFELEGKTRHDIGREALVARIWQWKDQYQQRIVKQLQRMGCSCDWHRVRFTMDRVCSRAVRETFFNMFQDGLIYRGYRLVNWDVQLQTAVSDDEIVYETVQGHFWHIRYPVIGPQSGEPAFITVATTRPETMLGDTAVACHPDPARALNETILKMQDRLKTVPAKERSRLEQELAQLEQRKTSHLPLLLALVDMARAGRKILLPLMDREIPLITDEWAKPELGSGCVKITPGHDPNDYDVWLRHQAEIDLINILHEDGRLNDNAGPYAGQDRLKARDRVVADLQDRDLLELIEDREIEIGHSDRSKTPIEPFLSKQWFVNMSDLDGGIVFGRGTKNEFRADGLAQAAIDAVAGAWRSPTGRKLVFHPDPVRYGDTYVKWLSEKRDWCISRQLWWGHRLPIWRQSAAGPELDKILQELTALMAKTDQLCAWCVSPEGQSVTLDQVRSILEQDCETSYETLVCLRSEQADDLFASDLESRGFVHDPDVLDTWFSSALWPHSTLGWPDPNTAEIEPGQSAMTAPDQGTDTLSYYYPGSCLVTGRDIITLWVARMVITGLYNLGDLPFTDSFIHANILDGKGERMSKSKGNGIDPVDILDNYGVDAMRYVLCDMQTGTQDIRLPVQAISPHSGEVVDLATAKHGRSIFTYICPKSGKEFDVLGTMPDLPAARIVSDRFDVGKHFCNKIWNASRFALLNLESQPFRALETAELLSEDRWVLSRLNAAITDVTQNLESYNPSAAIAAARHFFWDEFCDWYLELIKPRFRNADQAFVARQMLAAVLDQVLRLFHPFMPFISEAIWEQLNRIMPERGVNAAFGPSELLALASWPKTNQHWQQIELEQKLNLMQDVIRAIRNVRSKHNVQPGARLKASIKAPSPEADILQDLKAHISNLALLDELTIRPDIERPQAATMTVFGEMEIYLEGVIDPETERQRLLGQHKKTLEQLEKVRQKLDNENFISRAPADVVQQTRAKTEELEAQLKTIEHNLAGLTD